MSSHRVVSLFTCLLLAAPLAVAGNITGTVTGQDAVVWIEGDLPPDGRRAVVISQRGVRFTPDFAVVVAGTTVEMPNDDDVAHNVYSFSPAEQFNLGVYATGDSRSIDFKTPGVVEMKCWLHKRMKATVIVVPNRFYAIASNGVYRINDVPAGTYRVVVWRRDMPQLSSTVKVAAAGAAHVDF